ncbi:protein EVI2B [Nannospalax galili]|uniref:Ecotropic viral integration site 2b n=1 Tax=Nannospalax galili TaxID=1026970 RepID=A0A8C6RCH7_NANGA|nr:protein EVI2B [Nannospalax galili]
MDAKYFILILFCQYLNNARFSETEASATEKQPQSTLLVSPVPYASTNSPNTKGNDLSQTTQFNNISARQQLSPAKIPDGQPTPAVYVSSRKPALHTSARPSAYNITRQAISTVNNSFLLTPLPGFTSARQLPPSTHTFTRQTPRPFVHTPTQQSRSSPSLAPTSSGRPVLQTAHYQSTKPTPPVYLPRTVNLPKNTSPFTSDPTSGKGTPHKTNYNAIAAILIGAILISLLVVILIIVLWKYLRKPVLNDQNWAGRSPFADGETPDLCMDNIRENEASTKRTSIVSLMTWKPSKNTLLPDDLEVKLFEASENTEDTKNLKAENVKDQVNGTSEDSADRSTIGTAVSSSDDADLPLPPPLLDLEGQERNQSDKPTMITVSSLPNDSTNLQPSLGSLNQACEDHDSEIKQSLPPPPDSFNLHLSPVDFIKNHEDVNHEIQYQFSIPPDSDQDLTESLPPPPTELL